MKPIQNTNSGACEQCGIEDTVELVLRHPIEKVGDTVRWCINGHVTCYNSSSRKWSTVFDFKEDHL